VVDKYAPLPSASLGHLASLLGYGAPHLRAETRARVRAVAAELGFRPNDLAQSIFRGRTFTVGLLTTVLGFGKDTVARKYLSLAMKRHVPSLDLSVLFAGATS